MRRSPARTQLVRIHHPDFSIDLGEAETAGPPRQLVPTPEEPPDPIAHVLVDGEASASPPGHQCPSIERDVKRIPPLSAR
jgi:hypothetical protein